MLTIFEWMTKVNFYHVEDRLRIVLTSKLWDNQFKVYLWFLNFIYNLFNSTYTHRNVELFRGIICFWCMDPIKIEIKLQKCQFIRLTPPPFFSFFSHIISILHRLFGKYRLSKDRSLTLDLLHTYFFITWIHLEGPAKPSVDQNPKVKKYCG